VTGSQHTTVVASVSSPCPEPICIRIGTTKVKWARLFQPHFFQKMRGSRVKLKDLKQG